MQSTHIKGLDGIRAISVFLVIVSHWIAKDSIVNILPNGAIGVDVFFVLSGFLITRILIESGNESKSNSEGVLGVLKIFYIRRFLRIFPLYYLVLFSTLLFSSIFYSEIENSIKYHFAYLSNFLFYFRSSWDGNFSHLWSLAVEEQFYLVWPLLILLSSKRGSLLVIVLSLVIGLFSEMYFIKEQFGKVLPNTCLHAFSLGALISWLSCYKKDELLSKCRTKMPAYIFGSSILLIALKVLFSIDIFPLRFIDSLLGLSAICFVLAAPSEHLVLRILEIPFVRHLGKVSYGLYLLHNFTPTALNYLFNSLLPGKSFLEVAGRYYGVLNILANSVFLILISTILFRYFEKPVLNLKNKFEYKS